MYARTEVLHNLITHPPQANHLYLFHMEYVCVCLHVKVLPFIPSLQRFVVLAPDDVGRQNKTTSHLIWRQRYAKQRNSLEWKLLNRSRVMMSMMLLLLNLMVNILNHRSQTTLMLRLTYVHDSLLGTGSLSPG